MLSVFKYSNSEDQITASEHYSAPYKTNTSTLRLDSASGAFQIYCTNVDISIDFNDFRTQLSSNMINDYSGRDPSATFIVFTPFKLTSDDYNTIRNMEQYLEGQC
jgi:hypothetical protein